MLDYQRVLQIDIRGRFASYHTWNLRFARSWDYPSSHPVDHFRIKIHGDDWGSPMTQETSRSCPPPVACWIVPGNLTGTGLPLRGPVGKRVACRIFQWAWKNTMKNKGIAIPKKDRQEIYHYFRFRIWLFDLFGGCFNIIMGTVSVPNDLCMEFSRSFTPKITQKWNSIHGVYKYGYSSGKNHHSSSDHTHVCCMHMLTIVVHSTQC